MAAAGSAWLDLEIILFWKGLYRIRILQVYMQLPYSDVAFIFLHNFQKKETYSTGVTVKNTHRPPLAARKRFAVSLRTFPKHS